MNPLDQAVAYQALCCCTRQDGRLRYSRACPLHSHAAPPARPLVTRLAPRVLLTRNDDLHTLWVAGRVVAQLPYMEV